MPIVMAATALVLMSGLAAEYSATPNTSAAALASKPSLAPGEKTQAGPPAAAPAAAGKEVALKMVFMCAHAAKKQAWWKEVHLMIWWSFARLTSTDKDVQDYLKRLQDAGVVVVACRACADRYGVSKTLEGLGIEVKYMGQPLTEILKRSEKLRTF